MKKLRAFFSAVIAAVITISALSITSGAASEIAFSSHYVQKLYDDTNGIPSNEINALLQTSDGYMWFGTYSGVTRFDGTNFITYNALSDDNFPSSSVRALYEDSKGRLWIATNDCGAVCYEDGAFTVYDKSDGACSNSIRSITENKDGIVLFGTTDGIFGITPEGEVKTEYSGSSDEFAVSLLCDNDNLIHVVQNDGKYKICNATDKSNIDVGEKFGINVNFTALALLSDGSVAAGTATGEIYIGGLNGYRRLSIGSDYDVNDIYEDKNGCMWVCSSDGVGYFNEDGSFNQVKNLNATSMYKRITEDNQGNFWIGTSADGALELTWSPFIDYSSQISVSRKEINAITKSGDLWYIATNDMLYIVDEQGKTVTNALSTMLKGIRVRSVMADSKGYIWVCIYDEECVLKFDPKSCDAVAFCDGDGIESDKARCSYEMNDGTIAIGTANGVFFIKDDVPVDNKDVFGTAENLPIPETVVLSMTQTEDGKFFIGTDGNGIYIVDNGELKHISDDDGLGSGIILRVTAHGKGVWLSNEVGISYIDENLKITDVNREDLRNVFDIHFDNNDKMWVIAGSDIWVGEENDFLNSATSGAITVLEKTQGLYSAVTSNSWHYLDENGVLYLCCIKGIAAVETDKYSTGSFVPRTAITSITTDGVVYDNISDNMTITLPKDNRRITFDIALLNFGTKEDTHVEYYLEGQDEEAVIATASDISGDGITYTNLNSGLHEFRIYSITDGGVKGNEITIILDKQYGWWEQPYFIVPAVLCGCLIIVGITFLFMHHKQKTLIKKQLEYKTIIIQAVSAISNTIDAKDKYTRGHSVRVAAYSAEIARRMKQSDEFVERIYYIGLLHDIGKIGIDSSIINKPGRLTDEEYAIMKQHPLIGYEILKDITTLKNIAIGARDHHEHYDGKGYNAGLSGEEIALEARIICVADSYDAMSSKRSYRDGMSREYILSEFKRCRGTQFDPLIADIMIKMLEDGYFDKLDMNKLMGVKVSSGAVVEADKVVEENLE